MTESYEAARAAQQARDAARMDARGENHETNVAGGLYRELGLDSGQGKGWKKPGPVQHFPTGPFPVMESSRPPTTPSDADVQKAVADVIAFDATLEN